MIQWHMTYDVEKPPRSKVAKEAQRGHEASKEATNKYGQNETAPQLLRPLCHICCQKCAQNVARSILAYHRLPMLQIGLNKLPVPTVVHYSAYTRACMGCNYPTTMVVPWLANESRTLEHQHPVQTKRFVWKSNKAFHSVK